MPAIAALPLLPLIAGVFLLVLAVMLLVAGPAPAAEPTSRLSQYIALGHGGSPGLLVQDQGARERLLAPAFRRVLELAASTAPDRVRKTAAADLTKAGSRMTPTVFLGIRGLALFGLPLLGALFFLSSPERGPAQWGLLGMSLVWGRKLPTMWLRRRIKARQRAIDRALPYALDLMVACLEGGLSLDATLAKVAEDSTGPLADEIHRTLQELTLGRPSMDALRDLGTRSGAPDLKRLTENIVQAERMGIGIVQAMQTLAQDSRVRRRQRAEEMARKAPIKMVPVLIFCILPALAAVVMTPAVLIIIRVFSTTIPA